MTPARPTADAAPGRCLPPAGEFLYWPPQFQAYGYRIVDQLFATRVVARGPSPQTLPRGPQLDLTYQSGKVRRGIDEFMLHNVVAGLLVIKDGRVVLERYGLGLGESDRWTTMSTIKSVSALMVGAAVHEGLITSLDDPIGRYLPALGHCAYAAVTIRQLLTMTSGILWNEDYADPQSDVNEYSRCLAQRRRGGVMDLVRGLPAQYPPGSRWQYNTGNSYLMGAVLAAAVGGHLADYLSTRLWQPAGMEFDAYYTLDAEDGLEIAGSRAGMALRDIGRVAKFVLDDGVIGTRRVLPEGFVEQALSPSHLFTARDREFGQIVAARLSGYGYSWWMQEGGGAVALGHAGQRIFIDRRQSLAVITLSAFPQLPHVPAPLPDREGEVVRFTDAVRDALR